MRLTVAVMAATSAFFVGVVALGEAASQTEASGALNSTSANASYNMSVDVFSGLATGGGEAIVWFGVAAIVMAALGLLVWAGSSGR